MNPNANQANLSVLDMRGVAASSRKDAAVTVAEGVNWTVQPGEFWVVGAPQYSGKTDFLLMAGGLSAPASGEYFFLGERMPIFEEPRLAHRLKLGFVFDGGQLLGQLNVGENVALPLRYHQNLGYAEAESRVRAILEFTGLNPWANHMPGEIGRSWRQRAGLARALVLHPEVLLLDSPLTGLDVRHATWWLGMLSQLSRGHSFMGDRPVTVIATADDLRPWRGHANRVACLAEKRFRVLGDWQTATKSGDATVNELLPEASRGD